DEMVQKKIRAVLRHEMTPIVCVGETLDQREEGRATDVVVTQLRGALSGLDAEQVGGLAIAYGPVWAVGTGRSATPGAAGAMGETLDQREEGRATDGVVTQLRVALSGLDAEQVGGLAIAYEPVWAIGTGRNATPDDAGEMCEVIRNEISELAGSDAAESVRILYGGSVNPGNIKAMMAKRHIDGALVGGASLDPDTFAAVVRYWIWPLASFRPV